MGFVCAPHETAINCRGVVDFPLVVCSTYKWRKYDPVRLQEIGLIQDQMKLRTYIPGVIALATFGVIFPTSAWPQEPSIGKSFFDDFDHLDTSRWLVSDGWVNGEWQNCTWSKRAVSVTEGILKLHFRQSSNTHRDYICGEVQSHQKYGLGDYEVRMLTPKGSGLNAAFFTYTGPSQGTAHDEIDFEVLLRDTHRVSLNTYVSGIPENGATVELPHESDVEFVKYAFIWGHDGVKWYADDKLVHSSMGSGPLPTIPQKIFTSLWGSDTLVDWMGPFVAPDDDLVVQIDWISYTQSDQGCQFPQSVLCTQE